MPLSGRLVTPPTHGHCFFASARSTKHKHTLTMTSILGSARPLIQVGPKSRNASTSMSRLPSFPTTRPCRRAPCSSSTYATISPTAPRSSQRHPTNASRHPRIDEVDHIPTSALGRVLLTAGSALGLLNNPSRGGKSTLILASSAFALDRN